MDGFAFVQTMMSHGPPQPLKNHFLHFSKHTRDFAQLIGRTLPFLCLFRPSNMRNRSGINWSRPTPMFFSGWFATGPPFINPELSGSITHQLSQHNLKTQHELYQIYQYCRSSHRFCLCCACTARVCQRQVRADLQ